jgi:hypothetical protein
MNDREVYLDARHHGGRTGPPVGQAESYMGQAALTTSAQQLAGRQR